MFITGEQIFQTMSSLTLFYPLLSGINLFLQSSWSLWQPKRIIFFSCNSSNHFVHIEWVLQLLYQHWKFKLVLFNVMEEHFSQYGRRGSQSKYKSGEPQVNYLIWYLERVLDHKWSAPITCIIRNAFSISALIAATYLIPVESD